MSVPLIINTGPPWINDDGAFTNSKIYNGSGPKGGKIVKFRKQGKVTLNP
jgi:hypothetical protein